MSKSSAEERTTSEKILRKTNMRATEIGRKLFEKVNIMGVEHPKISI